MKILTLFILFYSLFLTSCGKSSNKRDTSSEKNTIVIQNRENIPANCKVWYDGCNDCQVTNGTPTACTMRACIQQADPYCKE